MKIRNGFVSNSSSASFVIVWRCDTEQGSDGEALPLSEALDILWEYGNTELKNKLIEKTVVETNGSFRTTSHTSMFNDYSDFSLEIKELLFALEARKVDEYNTRAVFDIINKYIDRSRLKNLEGEKMEKKKSESDIWQTHQEWIAYRYRVHQAMYGKRKNNGDSHDDEMEDFAFAYIQDCGSRD